jgi:hypothetical protein
LGLQSERYVFARIRPSANNNMLRAEGRQPNQPVQIFKDDELRALKVLGKSRLIAHQPQITQLPYFAKLRRPSARGMIRAIWVQSSLKTSCAHIDDPRQNAITSHAI